MPKFLGGKLPKGISYDLDDMIIIPGFTEKDATYENVKLETELAPNVILRYPFIAAAMSCVSGYDMTLESAKNGIMAVVPRSLAMEEQADIVKKVKEQEVKKGEIEFNTDPVMIKDLRKSIRDAVELYNEYGHSNIPIGNDFRCLKGMFKYQEGISGNFLDMDLETALEKVKGGNDYLGEIIKPFDLKSSKHGIDYFLDTDSKEDIHKEMDEKKIKVIPIIKKGGALTELAFIHEYHGYMVGAAIHTYPGWEERVKKLDDARADMIFIDTSDARSRFQLDVISEFKKKYPGIPLCAGNIVSGEGYKELVEAGADLVKYGMGSGGACITSVRRGPGRGLLTASDDIWNTKEKMDKDHQKPIIADGGIGVRLIKMIKAGDYEARIYEHNPASILKSLGFADAVMMGTAFNMLMEAPGRTLEFYGKKYKERWGEGSLKGISMARYGIGESVKRALVEEGVYDLVSLEGRLKPYLEKTALNIAMTIGNNVGARNLKEYRERMTYELLSPTAWRKTGVE